jgi:hypothetical protein
MILDCAKARGATPNSNSIYPGEEIVKHGFALLGGCLHCEASIACYNTYPSRNGHWCCEDCIGSQGFDSTEEFEKWLYEVHLNSSRRYIDDDE